MEEIGRGSQEPTNQLEVPIYGSGRVGVYYKQEKESVYQLSDHLGNVRMTFRVDENGEAIASTKQDYYPFGWKMPGRHQQGSKNYRYGYQGEFAEQDDETGWNHFELRMWDGRVGRWMTTDPYGQHFSPYMSMDNNPVSTVDPDGGFDTRKERRDWKKAHKNEFGKFKNARGTDGSFLLIGKRNGQSQQIAYGTSAGFEIDNAHIRFNNFSIIFDNGSLFEAKVSYQMGGITSKDTHEGAEMKVGTAEFDYGYRYKKSFNSGNVESGFFAHDGSNVTGTFVSGKVEGVPLYGIPVDAKFGLKYIATENMNPHSFSGLNAPKLHKAYAGIGTYGAEAKSTYNFSNTTLTNQIGLQEDWNLLKMPGGVVKLDIRGQIYNAIKFKGY